MSRHTAWLGTYVAVAVLATTTGCGSSGEKADVTTSSESYDALLRRADTYAQDTLTSVFGAGVTLEPLEGSNPLVAFCSDVSDPPRGTPVNAENDFKVVGADPARITDYAAAFEKHWTDAGWTHTHGTIADGGTTMGSDDDFSVLLSFAPGNDLISLTVTTPCVAPKDPDDPLAG